VTTWPENKPRVSGGKLFFLPKYSPDLNSIEQVFAKLSTCRARPPRDPSKPSAR
jgi:transposase